MSECKHPEDCLQCVNSVWVAAGFFIGVILTIVMWCTLQAIYEKGIKDGRCAESR